MVFFSKEVWENIWQGKKAISTKQAASRTRFELGKNLNNDLNNEVYCLSIISYMLPPWLVKEVRIRW
jgi:hypothetical protein